MNIAIKQSVLLEKSKRMLLGSSLIPLILLLFGLIVALEFMQPGIVSIRWLGNTVRFAIPLAMLAACQTATMLTGGIDLSAGTVATFTAFITATLLLLFTFPIPRSTCSPPLSPNPPRCIGADAFCCCKDR